MRASMVWLVLAMALSPAAAQSQAAASSPMDRATAEIAAGRSATSTADSTAANMVPEPPSAVAMSDSATRQKYLEAMQRYFEYRANGYEFRSRVFEWQLSSSRAIFVVVLLLVGVGIYFAAVQFHVALSAARRSAAPPGTGPGNAPIADGLNTQLEITAKGIIVNSSVMGVVILALSLAFFYLFLVYVYPIENVL